MCHFNMDIEEESMVFLEYHLDDSFGDIREDIRFMEWLTTEEGGLRPYALTFSNLNLLFPPFYPKSKIK